jgi:hypothetical protein
MMIISVQNFLEKCHNKSFLRDIALYFVTAIARDQIKIKSSVDKAFWDKTKSFLQYKGASVELKRAKTPENQFFQSPTRRPPPKPLLQLTFIRPQQRFREVFGLKRPSMSVPNLFFAMPSPKLPLPLLFSLIGIEKGRVPAT